MIFGKDLGLDDLPENQDEALKLIMEKLSGGEYDGEGSDLDGEDLDDDDDFNLDDYLAQKDDPDVRKQARKSSQSPKTPAAQPSSTKSTTEAKAGPKKKKKGRGGKKKPVDVEVIRLRKADQYLRLWRYFKRNWFTREWIRELAMHAVLIVLYTHGSPSSSLYRHRHAEGPDQKWCMEYQQLDRTRIPRV